VVVPLVYALLPGKSVAIYKKALAKVLEKLDLVTPGSRPKKIILDFEKAEELAFRELIPTADLHGCYFHFKQCIWRNIQRCGLAGRYEQENQADFCTILKMFAALTFVEPGFFHQLFN
jgi:hypothetical protein